MVITLVTIPAIGLAKTYTGNKLLTSVVKTTGNLMWNVNSTFKKKLTVTKRLLAKGPVTLGNAITDLVKINGTVSSTLGAVEINDDVHITGQLDLDQPLANADLPISGIVTSLTEGDNIDITDNGSGSYTIAATDTDTDITYSAGTGLSLTGTEFASTLGTSISASELDSNSCSTDQILKYNGSAWACAADTDTDTNTTYTASTGMALVGTAFSTTLGTSITSAELGASAVDAAALASTAIQSGDIETGDLPSLASTNLTDATSIGLLGDSETITGNWVNTTNPWADNEVANALTMSGGTINNSTIGATTASTGNFTNLTINGFARELPALQQLPRSNALTTVDSTTSDATGLYTAITVGTDGFPVISYYDNTNDNLMMAKCGNATCSSGNTLTAVDSTTSASTGLDTAITIGTDGFPVISYFDNTNDNLMMAKCGNAACSSGNTLTTVDSTTSADTGTYTSIAIGTDGFPVISYYDVTGTNLMMAKCGNAACSSGNTLSSVDANVTSADTGTYTSIAIGTDGFPVISYYDASGTNLMMAKCGNATCSSGNTLTAVDSSIFTATGTDTSITIGTDGFPVISYYDATNTNLMMAKCGNATCSSGNTLTAVDSTTSASTGLDTAITIGTDGFPVISYFDNTNDNLMMAKCGNAACSSGNTLTTVDSTTSDLTGTYTSITIGTDGFPVISYFDNTNDNLMMAQLANEWGLNYWTRR